MPRSGNPNPKTDHLVKWQKGQPGNPKGGSRKRSLTAAFKRLLKEKGFDKDLALVVMAMATGRKDLLEYKDINGNRAVRKPEYVWFRELIERLEGKVPDRLEADLKVEESDDFSDDELDHWATERARELAEERTGPDQAAGSQKEPGGLRQLGGETLMEPGTAPEAAQPEISRDFSRADQPVDDHDATPSR
jgi:hypothetical protein